MILKQLFDHDTWTFTYLLADPNTREAVIIDPVVEQVERDLRLIAELGLELVYTLDTHVHADHITGSGELRRQTGALSGVSAVANVPCADRLLSHGAQLAFGRYSIEVRSTPGHTNGCLTYVVNADGQIYAFTGDALFIRGCGRTDFQLGDSATLYRSVHDQIYSLPNDTVIYPGHDYRGHQSSTVGEEKAYNPRLRADISQHQFIEIMDALELADPARIHEALPANLGCGLENSHASDRAYREISTEKLHQLITSKIVDVRTPEEFSGPLGHLPGAILAPLPHLTEHAVDWSRDEEILVVCRSGRRSAQGCVMLSAMGFTNVTNLAGGMNAWHAQKELGGC